MTMRTKWDVFNRFMYVGTYKAASAKEAIGKHVRSFPDPEKHKQEFGPFRATDQGA